MPPQHAFERRSVEAWDQLIKQRALTPEVILCSPRKSNYRHLKGPAPKIAAGKEKACIKRSVVVNYNTR
jgi:hypothetical protein